MAKKENHLKFYTKLAGWQGTKPNRKSKILRVFLETHMSLNHNGLTHLCNKEGINPDQMERGEFVIFINKAQTAIKMLSAGNTIAYFKMPGNRTIDMGVIRLIPSFFTGNELDYKGALETLIKSRGVTYEWSAAV